LNLRFEVDGDNGVWLAADLGVTFELSQQWSLNLGYTYQEYSEIKSSMKVTDLITGSTTVYAGDSAGLDHSSKMLTLGANYRF
jgi:outer membrane protease